MVTKTFDQCAKLVADIPTTLFTSSNSTMKNVTRKMSVIC